MLMMFSMGTSADVKVLYGEKGTEKFEGTGGKIEVTQKESDDKTQVTVYLTVTPDNGYIMVKDGIELYATIPANAGLTRAPEISTELTPKCDDFKGGSQKRTYYVTIASELALWVKSATFALNGSKGNRDGVTYTYYALHNKDKGYLKQYKGIVGNDGTFRYDNTHADNGSSIWVYSSDGYLQQEMYYLNVLNGRTLVLSTTPVTQWDIVTDGDKKRFQLHESTKILGFDGSKVVLAESPTYKYAACTLTVTENNGKWEGPKDVSWEVQSPQLVTYLRAYYLRNITVKIDKNDKEEENVQVVNKQDSRAHCSLTYDNSQANPSGKGEKWNINTATGVIYNISSDNKQQSVAAKYTLTPLDPKVLANHPATTTTVTIKVNAKALVPDATKKYLLFNTQDNNYRFPKASSSLVEGELLPVNGKKSDLTEIVNGDISWDIEVDGEGYYSFKNVTTGRYIFYDAADYTVSDYGALKIGSTAPGSDTRYKFRLYSNAGNRNPFGNCLYIIPYDKQFAVWKSSGVLAELYFALYMNTSGSTKIASIYKASDNAKWKIYTYEWEYHLWDDYSIDGDQSLYATGAKTYTASTWFSRNIKGSPNSGEYCMLPGSKTHDGITYIWELTGLTDYISTSDALASGTSTLTASVNSLPPGTRSGTLKVTAKVTAPANINNNKTIPLTLYNLNPTLVDIDKLSDITDENGLYRLTADNTYSSSNKPGVSTFSGSLTAKAKDDGSFPVISGLTSPLFTTAKDATISNIMLKSVSISQDGYVGAIACTANGNTRIYNCGILPTTAQHEATGRSTVTSTDDHCGSLVGYLDGKARVINCFSYANVSAKTSDNKNAGGLVGYNTTATTQGNSEINFNNNCKTMVVNCMFYGDITQGNIKRPVYGGTAIANNAEHTANNYNYFCQEEISFESTLDNISKYNNTWPVAKKYLTRFEIYRNILNSNRRLCSWWVNGAYNTAPTDANVETIGIAKWVLDLSIAPYPILKKWGKYPSVINQDPNKRVNPSTKKWGNRVDASDHWGKNMAPDTDGQKLGSITVTINGGEHHSGSSSRTINITAMDIEYKDYCYGKIQLPYYNEIFGNPNGATWAAKYGDNYGDYVVTGWEITSTNGSDADGHSFLADWQEGYNFADRKCTSKDLYLTSGRVFAQGGYYYVPDGVTTITIKAHWGKAVYLCNQNSRLDMINNAGNEFYNAGTLSFGGTNGILPLWPSTNILKTTLDNAIDGLSVNPTGSVYDQAIVLVGNYQNNNIQGGSGNTSKLILSGNKYDTNAKPFTIMSADFDLDNEPDFCFQAGMNDGGRPNIQPIRFDFLMVPDITMAIRKDANYLGMRIFCPQGHFEVTETSYMYTTQFEYDKRGTTTHSKHEAPLILNGGEFFQIVSKEQTDAVTNNPTTLENWECDRTSYFLLGGNLWMKAFTPGVHGNGRVSTRHCAVNAIGGEFPEFYLSGMFRTDFYNKTDNPHAYLDGGKFGLVAGAGMESVGGKNETNGGDVTFKINHSLIDEFYGGGINAQRPVTGNISVTIDNSKVTKYCGGPKLGDMNNTKTITTNATGTTFDEYYGGGNGGTNLLRERQYDAGAGVSAPTQNDHSHWDTTAKFTAFTPFSYTSGKGYQAEYEFEMLPRTSGNSNVITRSYYYWASFSKTTVAPVTNTITDCTFNGDFYGGGNLGAVDSPTSSTNPAISSTLSGHTVVHGSAFGAGYSASATSFKVHDKGSVVYPYRDNAGFIHDGSLDYAPTEYTWIHDIPTAWGKTASTSSPTFEYGGNSYCYTDVELTGLGTVTGNVSLTIEGTTEIDEDVYGGGDASAVNGNTTVVLQGNATVTRNVFGGGNSGDVSGSATVTIRETPTSSSGSGNGD